MLVIWPGEGDLNRICMLEPQGTLCACHTSVNARPPLSDSRLDLGMSHLASFRFD